MGEALLWGNGDRHLLSRDQDRLAELTVPGTELLLDALEGCELQVRAMDEG